jgi:hypothetical protein
MDDELDGMEEVVPGLSARRDEAGRFKETRLSSERAREMKLASGKTAREAKELNAAAILADAGVDWDSAPEHLRVLARIASGQSSGAVSALKDLRRLLGLDSPGEAAQAAGPGQRPKPGQICPTCKQPVLDIETARILLEAIRLEKERRGVVEKVPEVYEPPPAPRQKTPPSQAPPQPLPEASEPPGRTRSDVENDVLYPTIEGGTPWESTRSRE